MGRAERPLSCSMWTLYRLFERGNFDVRTLPIKGKRRPNGYVEWRGEGRSTWPKHSPTGYRLSQL